MRTKRAIYNFTASLGLQLITAISGLIIPKLIIEFYGSEVNGLITSINQFLSYITFFEAGLSGVVMALLYKPIAQNNMAEINQTLADGRDYFRKIAYVYILYVVSLIIIYPQNVSSSFDDVFIRSLIVIMSVTLLSQYLFGIINNIFIQANQKAYVTSTIQSFVVILNAVVSIAVIHFKGSIHMLKAATVLVSIINPLGYYLYVKKKYKIDEKFKGTSKNIKQRWDGMCHHICYFVQTNIDVMILTFVDLKLVSVYSVYHLITNMIRQILSSFTHAFKSALGDLIARGEQEKLGKVFSLFEYLIYTLSTVIFVSLVYVILPFVKLYTSKITDINYANSLFAVIMVLAEWCYTIRIPYHTVTVSAGHFQKTKIAAICEATINGVVSVAMVRSFGLIGVAIGTCVSCVYRTIYYFVYLHKNLLYLSYRKCVRRVLVNLLSVGMCIIVFSFIPDFTVSYLTWFVNGVLHFIISAAIVFPLNTLFFKDDFVELMRKIKGLQGRKNQ